MSSVVIAGDTSGTVTLSAPAVSGTTTLTLPTTTGTVLTNNSATVGSSGVTFSDGSTQTAAASPYVLKNRIINGDMRIDQRNAGTSVALGAGITAYPTDRFRVENNTTGTATGQQVSDAPTGFSNSLKYTVTATDASLAATENVIVIQPIEGFNTADLVFGTASAKTITISFWVKSSVTGTFGGSILNASFGRFYPYSYTISAANTWEYKTVTIAGDTTGTWIGATNGVGLRLMFCLAAASDRVAAAGAWTTSLGFGPTGQTNLMATSAATWQITGVQLEVGTTATPFERRLYNQELANCQRYYWRWSSVNQSFMYMSTAGRAYSTANGTVAIQHPVPMRTQAAMNNSNNFAAGNWDYSVTAIGINNGGYAAFPFNMTNLNITGTYPGSERIFALGSGSSTSTTIWIDFTAEL